MSEPAPASPAADFAELGGEPTAADAAAQKLQDKIADLELARREERFGWIVVLVLLIDVIWFRNAPNPTFPIAVLILQVLALFILARRLALPDVLSFIHAVLARLSDQTKV